MKHLREAERRKWPVGWRNKTWMLHHDNAPAHTSLLVCEFLAKHETVVPQPTYSPDTGPTHYPTKYIPEWEETLEAVYRQWRGVL
jgi:hypothetical protein